MSETSEAVQSLLSGRPRATMRGIVARAAGCFGTHVSAGIRPHAGNPKAKGRITLGTRSVRQGCYSSSWEVTSTLIL